MKLALVVHPYHQDAVDVATRLVADASRRGFAVLAAAADASRVPGTIEHDGGRSEEADFVVAVGGDGTMLQAVRVAVAADIPILGINAGHVGFLAEVEPARIPAALDALASGEYSESRRMTITAHLPTGHIITGLNDAVIEKAVSQHAVWISVSVGPERLVRYRADALVVATPTGSTAYTFSAGGPLVDPELEALVVTAVAPHNLFGRPIVFRPAVKLRLQVEGDRPARVNVDGRAVATLEPGESIEVARGDSAARFVRLSPRNFASAVRERFHLHDA